MFVRINVLLKSASMRVDSASALSTVTTLTTVNFEVPNWKELGARYGRGVEGAGKAP